jgi:hypothetical protein
MRIMGILVILSLIAFATDCKPLGALIVVFLIGCGVVGVADSIVNGTFDISKQRKRQWSENPDRVVEDFEAWKEAREERRRSRPGYAERRVEMDELIRKLNPTK